MRALALVLTLPLAGCAHITAVAPGPAPGEFYVLTERYNPLVLPVSVPQGYVLRCWAAPDGTTTCVRVLGAWEASAFYTAGVGKSARFGEPGAKK